MVLEQAASRAIDFGAYALAESDARQSLELYPVGLCQEILAQALYGQGKVSEALQAYEPIASGGQPRNSLPYAMLLLKSGQWASAVESYNKAIERLGFRESTSHIGLGDLIRADSHFSADGLPRKEDLEVAIHLAMGVLYNGTASWARNSQHGKALSEYQQALKIRPEAALVNYFYGYGLLQLKQNEKAQEAFAKAAKLGAGDVKKASEQGLVEVQQALAMKKSN